MILNDLIHVFAGFVILLSLAFGVEANPIFMSKHRLWLTVFVGADLFQFGFSKFRPLGFVLKKLGIPKSRGHNGARRGRRFFATVPCRDSP